MEIIDVTCFRYKLAWRNVSKSKPQTMAADESQIKSIIRTLVLHPDTFTPEHAHRAIHEIMSGLATQAQISAFLVACRLTQRDTEAEIVAACGRAMGEHALNVHFEDAALANEIVDIVGTGGDGFNTFNVSTTAAIVAAGAGVKVAKVKEDFCAYVGNTRDMGRCGHNLVSF